MSRDFNGSADYLSFGSAIVSGVPLTFSAWVQIDSLVSDSYVVGLGQSGANGTMFNLFVRTTGAVRSNAQNDAFTGDSATTTATLSTGAWRHIAAVLAANNSRSAYLDGANKVTSTNTISAGTVNRSFIGAGMEAGAVVGHTNGKIAEVGIWNADLTDAEIASLGKGFCPRLIRPQSLQAYVPVVGRYSPEIDLKGRSWTVNGAPTQFSHPRIFY